MKIKPLNMVDVARAVAPKPPYALLHSGQSAEGGNSFSYLAYDAADMVQGSDIAALKAKIESDKDGWWAGYLGYGLKNQLETLAHDAPSPIDLPDYWWIRFKTVLRLDHGTGELEAICGELPTSFRGLTAGSLKLDENIDRDAAFTSRDDSSLSKKNEQTTFTRDEYLRTVAETIDAINAGAFYEANITQKYWGELEKTPSEPLALFAQLASNANTPYSALMCLDEETHIYSASPECFLKADAHGKIRSLPIKGSMKRSADETQDESLKESLAASEKNRAENLMIVDLIRNDLSRVCEAGSVTVEALYDIKSYETIHHMVSQISGQLLSHNSTLDAVMASFPPGSMTGAPKIAAMQWCSKKEALSRGVYSGALGWMAGDGSADLSVVIRTLIVQDNAYEYQMGGAIVADSDPQEEWDEMRLKARTVESLFKS